MFKVYGGNKVLRLIGTALTIEQAEHIAQNRRKGTKSIIMLNGKYWSTVISS